LSSVVWDVSGIWSPSPRNCIAADRTLPKTSFDRILRTGSLGCLSECVIAIPLYRNPGICRSSRCARRLLSRKPKAMIWNPYAASAGLNLVSMALRRAFLFSPSETTTHAAQQSAY